MKLNPKIASLGLVAVFAATAITPASADGYQNRSKQQTDKNNMRNLGIAGAAVAALGLLTHNNTATLLGAAGVAIGGTQYDKDRKNQSQSNDYYYRDGRNGGSSNWNSANRYNNQNNNWNNSQNWNNNRNGNNNRSWNNNNQDRSQNWNNRGQSQRQDRDYDRH